MLKFFYDRVLLARPRLFLFLVLLAVAFLGWEARKLEIDASAETLTIEGDRDLKFSRLINARYGSTDFLVISYSPKEELFSDAVLDDLKRLSDELEALEGVDKVLSILDVPLLESSERPFDEVVTEVLTLESPEVKRDLAREEFQNSPLYRELLVSPDLKTTALQVVLPEDPLYWELLNRRNELRAKEREGSLTEAEATEYKEVRKRFKAHRDEARARQHKNIMEVRAVMDGYRDLADLFLGGVSMIADDLISFIKNDLKLFGAGVLVFLVLTLWLIFRQLRWILLPILCSALSVVSTCGLLGLFGWEVTVISSNFISLQLIITMAVVIHLIVRYRELSTRRPELDQRELVFETVISMAKPCFFAVLTTVAGFSSLILCDILPVITFGWMMSAGIAVSLFLTFLLFPALLALMPKLLPDTSFEARFGFTRILARFTEARGKLILFLSALLMAGAVIGCSRLVVENSFIDYFKETTELYQGMAVIDRQLGGTTPLDVLVDFEEETSDVEVSRGDEEDDLFDEFEEEFEEQKKEAQYWFTDERMEQTERIHDYLNSLPETGKVLSLGTLNKVGKSLNSGKPLDNFQWALIYNELSEEYRRVVLSPYVSVENNQVRFFVRVRDSLEGLRRDELLKRIRRDLSEKFGLKEENVHLAGLLLLYNNMLQSLFSSQILTLGAVVAALMFMFLILFRSLKIAIIAIFPNLLSVGTVLGFMGWAGIPLDMMTITIAAISVGIAVDDTIHYIHRFKREFERVGNYLEAMHHSHISIGYAMYYTSVSIIIGFSILVLSNFIPSIYFGLLTGLAMVIALLAALTLLPRLIIVLRPFGPETK